ncbi:MAG: polymer-forming cytoskeletal protein [Candidatus Gracilibacteria bacterium]|nr:polymer-forming cytoskeletal protein [Candidatus Gracilibacteria bacterium]
MFQSSSSNQAVSAEEFETVIGPLVKASGKLESSGNIKLAGSFKEGEIKAATLEITPEGKAEANIKVESLKVYGELHGNVNANKVEIGASGKVYGDINAGGNLVIQAGGIFAGKSVVSETKAVKPRVVTDKKED